MPFLNKWGDYMQSNVSVRPASFVHFTRKVRYSLRTEMEQNTPCEPNKSYRQQSFIRDLYPISSLQPYQNGKLAPVTEVSRSSDTWRENFADNAHKGEISRKAAKKISEKLEWMLYFAKLHKVYSKARKVTFASKLSHITLTLASKQLHSDIEIKEKLLHQFFTEAKTRWGMIHYIWWAEKQDNGNIHFHINTDKYVPKAQLAFTWNRIQDKLGYVERYLKSGHTEQPPSSRVEGIRKWQDLKFYMTGEIVKKIQKSGVEGRLWGCSYSLSRLSKITVTDDVGLYNKLINLFYNYESKVRKREWCDMLWLNFWKWPKALFAEISILFDSLITEAWRGLKGVQQSLCFNLINAPPPESQQVLSFN